MSLGMPGAYKIDAAGDQADIAKAHGSYRLFLGVAEGFGSFQELLACWYTGRRLAD